MAGDGQSPKGKNRRFRGDIDMVGTGHFGQVGNLQGLSTTNAHHTKNTKRNRSDLGFVCVCVCVCVRVCVCLHVPECVHTLSIQWCCRRCLPQRRSAGWSPHPRSHKGG